MRILKFGGTSVANSAQIKNIIEIIKENHLLYHDLCIVVSAQNGVTDQLVRLCKLITIQYSSCDIIIQEIEHSHLNVLKTLLAVEKQAAALAEVMALCNELSDICKGASLVGELTSRTQDLILSFGERLSAFVISKLLESIIPDTQFVDARQIIKTDSYFGHARVNFKISNQLIKEYFSTHKGLKVVTGFIAESMQGQTTTLGRSGSDIQPLLLVQH